MRDTRPNSFVYDMNRSTVTLIFNLIILFTATVFLQVDAY